MKRACLLLLALSALACSRPRPADVLIVTIDTLRADHVGAYGFQRETSPVIDGNAAEGVLFETAYAPVGADEILSPENLERLRSLGYLE